MWFGGNQVGGATARNVILGNLSLLRAEVVRMVLRCAALRWWAR